MFNFLSDWKYYYIHMTSVKQELQFTRDKKQLLMDCFISFIITTVMFVLVGLLFNQLDNVRYLFYMMYVSVLISTFVSYYIPEMAFLKQHDQKRYFIKGFNRDMIVVLTYITFAGLALIQFVYAPLFSIIDTMLLLVILVLSTGLLLYFDYDYKIQLYTFFEIIIHTIYVSIITMIVLSFLPVLSLSLSFLIPIVIILILSLLKLTMIPTLYFSKGTWLSINVNKVLVVFVFAILWSSNTFVYSFTNNDINQSFIPDFYSFQLDSNVICDWGDVIDTYSDPDFIIQEDRVFLQNSRSIDVYDTDCTLVTSYDTSDSWVSMYLRDNDVHILRNVTPEEELIKDYYAYQFTMFKDDDFVDQRVVYQYTLEFNPLFDYNGQWAYRVPDVYATNNGHYIPYIQVYGEESNYGEDVLINQDVIHYQDDSMIIFQSNGLTLKSHYVRGQSYLYSNGYMLSFNSYPNYDDEFYVLVESIDSALANDRDYVVTIPKADLGITYNIMYDFYYLNNTFYMYTNDTLFRVSESGDLIDSIPNIPSGFQIIGDELYFMKDRQLLSIDLNQPGHYEMIAQTHITIAELYDGGDADIYNNDIVIHRYHAILDILLLVVASGIISIPVKQKHLS